MGRLTLNILLSFAQFEREIIGERIRDKITAQARKGKWIGGIPVLGYDVDRSGPSPKLVINAKEATRVREIFRMYIQEASLLPVVKGLARRGWGNKHRVTKRGRELGGRPFDKSSLYQLLINPIYTGKMRFKDELFQGEHEAIIEQELFDKVQQQLKTNRRSGSAEVRNKYGAVLRGLLRCKSCGTSMAHTFCSGRARSFYRYYRCTHAIKNGHEVCSSGTLPAGEIERVVVDEVRSLGKDEALLARVVGEAHAAVESELVIVRKDRDDVRQERARHHKELLQLTTSGKATTDVSGRIANLHVHLLDADQRLPELDARIETLETQIVTKDQARAVFADFDGLWQSLIPREQARLLKLLISTVEYDGEAGTVSVTFRPTSINSLIHRQMEKAA